MTHFRLEKLSFRDKDSTVTKGFSVIRPSCTLESHQHELHRESIHQLFYTTESQHCAPGHSPSTVQHPTVATLCPKLESETETQTTCHLLYKTMLHQQIHWISVLTIKGNMELFWPSGENDRTFPNFTFFALNDLFWLLLAFFKPTHHFQVFKLTKLPHSLSMYRT